MFKSKISIAQFIAYTIVGTTEVFMNGIDKVIALCDESNMLKEQDKECLKNSVRSLILVGTVINILIHFKKHISSEDSSSLVTVIYGRYLKEEKGFDDNKIEEIITNANGIFDKFDTFNESTLSRLPNEDEKLRFMCCESFSDIFAGNNLGDEYYRYKHFVAFKLAKNLVIHNFVDNLIKQYRISWDN